MKNIHDIANPGYFDDFDFIHFVCTGLVLSTPMQLFCHCAQINFNEAEE